MSALGSYKILFHLYILRSIGILSEKNGVGIEEYTDKHNLSQAHTYDLKYAKEKNTGRYASV
jgi:hypothetical protein